MGGASDAPAGYTRKMLREGGRVRIESRCDYCGLLIFGSVPELSDQEREHRDQCDKTKTARQSG